MLSKRIMTSVKQTLSERVKRRQRTHSTGTGTGVSVPQRGNTMISIPPLSLCHSLSLLPTGCMKYLHNEARITNERPQQADDIAAIVARSER